MPEYTAGAKGTLFSTWLARYVRVHGYDILAGTPDDLINLLGPDTYNAEFLQCTSYNMPFNKEDDNGDPVSGGGGSLGVEPYRMSRTQRWYHIGFVNDTPDINVSPLPPPAVSGLIMHNIAWNAADPNIPRFILVSGGVRGYAEFGAPVFIYLYPVVWVNGQTLVTDWPGYKVYTMLDWGEGICYRILSRYGHSYDPGTPEIPPPNFDIYHMPGLG